MQGRRKCGDRAKNAPCEPCSCDEIHAKAACPAPKAEISEITPHKNTASLRGSGISLSEDTATTLKNTATPPEDTAFSRRKIIPHPANTTFLVERGKTLEGKTALSLGNVTPFTGVMLFPLRVAVPFPEIAVPFTDVAAPFSNIAMLPPGFRRNGDRFASLLVFDSSP